MGPSKFLDGAMSYYSLCVASGRNWSILEQFAVALPEKKKKTKAKKNTNNKRKKHSKKGTKLYIYIIIIIITLNT